LLETIFEWLLWAGYIGLYRPWLICAGEIPCPITIYGRQSRVPILFQIGSDCTTQTYQGRYTHIPSTLCARAVYTQEALADAGAEPRLVPSWRVCLGASANLYSIVLAK
jgi:hypothetical protein